MYIKKNNIKWSSITAIIGNALLAKILIDNGYNVLSCRFWGYYISITCLSFITMLIYHEEEK